MGRAIAGAPTGPAIAGLAIMARRRIAIEGRAGAVAGGIPPRAPGEGASDKPRITPPSIIFLGALTEPPFFSFKITEGSVVIILTIGLN
jgi:hypothetical protein